MRMATLAAGLALLATPAFAENASNAPPANARNSGGPGPVDGYVTIAAKSADVGVGYTWGDGVLRYDGHIYHFNVKGLDVAAVGYSKIVGHGRVYNLHHLHDFNGTYGAANGEATIAHGVGGRFLENGNGVQLRITDITKGARLAGGAQGIELTLKPQ